MPENSKNRPAHEIRYGSIKVVIWRNETQNGPMFNLTAARLFKDGDQWNESSSFGYDDLLVLAKALNDAHSWIHTQKEAAKSAT